MSLLKKKFGFFVRLLQSVSQSSLNKLLTTRTNIPSFPVYATHLCKWVAYTGQEFFRPVFQLSQKMGVFGFYLWVVNLFDLNK